MGFYNIILGMTAVILDLIACTHPVGAEWVLLNHILPSDPRPITASRSTTGHRGLASLLKDARIADVHLQYPELYQHPQILDAIVKKSEHEIYMPTLHKTITRKLRASRDTTVEGKVTSSGSTMVFFECLSGQALCNDGYGPAITYRAHALPVCVCLCPKGQDGPQCNKQNNHKDLKRQGQSKEQGQEHGQGEGDDQHTSLDDISSETHQKPSADGVH